MHIRCTKCGKYGTIKQYLAQPALGPSCGCGGWLNEVFDEPKTPRQQHTDLVLGRLETFLGLDHLSSSDKAKIELAVAEIKHLRDLLERPAVVSVPETLTKEQRDTLITQWTKDVQPVFQEMLASLPACF